MADLKLLPASFQENIELRRTAGVRGRCWLWTAGLVDGYGKLRVQGKLWLAHRYAYTVIYGDVGDEVKLHHKCRIRNCTNPSHLQPTTNEHNTLIGGGPTAQNFRKEYCKHGHPFTQANIYWEGTKRRCRACQRVRQQRRKLSQQTAQTRQRPTNETLLELLQDFPATHVAEMYGVSDTTVRNWAKQAQP